MNQELPILYTPVQTARIMGISRSQVYNLMNSGDLNSIHIGRSRRIANTHVQQFIQSLEKVAQPMNNDRKVSDNSKDQIIVIVETELPVSTNRNLSTTQFGSEYTRVDVWT